VSAGRILLVDDSPFILDGLARVAAGAGFEVAGRAPHGAAALELAEAVRPDLVSLDVDMPVLNGLATLKQLLTRRPVATVMVSALTAEESTITFECLRLGAVDFVGKLAGADARGIDLQRAEIGRAYLRAVAVPVRRIRHARMRRPSSQPGRSASAPPSRVVACTAGRGGMAQLLRVLNGFPAGIGAALVFLVDLSPQVLRSFSAYVEHFSALRVTAPSGSVPLRADTAYLVSTGQPALVVSEGGSPWLRSFQPPAGSLPEKTAEHFHESVVDAMGRRAAGLLLSGAPPGSERGLLSMRQRGLPAFCESPESCVDPATPLRAVQLSAANRTGDVDVLLPELVARLAVQG